MVRTGKTYRAGSPEAPNVSILWILQIALMAMAGLIWVPLSGATDAGQNQTRAAEGKIRVDNLAPDHRGGRAYRLVYVVPVPIETHWAFKTDFDNDFLVNNKYIVAHRFVSRTNNVVITEDKYGNGPDVFFKWETKVIPAAYRLEFTLVNARACGQRFHYGYIQLRSVAGGTRVTQVAYFDFRGVGIWAAYPWRGGMRQFLLYTARWEQDTIVRLKHHYTGN